MKQISFVKDVETGELYGFIVRNGDSAVAVGATPHAKTWASWANYSKMLSDQMTKSLDVTLEKSDSFDLNTKRLEVLKSRLPASLYKQIVHLADDDAMILRGTRHKTMGARFVSKTVTSGKNMPSGVATQPLSAFSPADRKAVMEYKAVFSETRQKYSTLNIQVKKNRAIFDADIGSGGGWRCPDGTLYGGQITDRFGRGCGGGLTRRIGRAIMNAGRRLDDLGETLDQRQTVRRAARVERQAARREKRGKRIARVSNSLEAMAQALVGDYKPLEGITPRRRRRRGGDLVDSDLPEVDVPRARRRKLTPSKPKRTVLDDSLKKPRRQRRGTAPKPSELTPATRKASERLARRLVGDYQPLEGIESRRRSRRGEGDDRTLWQKFQDAIERFVARLIGDYQPMEGIDGRRDRRRREVEEKIPEKKPSGKKPDPKKPDSKKPAPKKPSSRKPSSKKPDSKKPVPKKKDRLAEINDELKQIEADKAAMQGKTKTQDVIDFLDDLDKRRAELLVERAKLESANPMPTNLPTGGKKPKPSKDAPSAKKAGKQYGGKFKTSESAKSKAVERSMESGKSLIVVQTADDKYQIVDADRVQDDPSLTPLFSVTPEGGFVTWDSTLSFEDNMTLREAAIDLEEKDIIEELKPIPVEELDLELAKSKTGSFLPDDMNSIMLENRRQGADADFRKAFHEQRLKNWSYWKNQVGEEQFKDVAEAKDALAVIDAHYKKVSETSPVDEALLGQLRAERKNFLAMWVPDDGMDEVNFYDRFNYVNPKRRQAIVQQADLGEMLVGKKAKKGKEAKKKPNVDASISPDNSVVPDPSKPDVPNVPDTKTPDPKVQTRLKEIDDELKDIEKSKAAMQGGTLTPDIIDALNDLDNRQAELLDERDKLAPKTPDTKLSVPSSKIEPNKVLNLGDNPGKYVMSYKQGLKSSIQNSNADPFDILYETNEQIDSNAAKMVKPVQELEELVKNSESELSNLRQLLSDKIKNKEDVREQDVINLIRAENSLRFHQKSLEANTTVKDEKLKEKLKENAALAQKIDTDKTNVQLTQKKNFDEAKDFAKAIDADNNSLYDEIDKSFGFFDTDALKTNYSASITAMDDYLSVQKYEVNTKLNELHQKVAEGVATEDEIQAVVAEQGKVQKLAEIVNTVKKKHADGSLFPEAKKEDVNTDFNVFRKSLETHMGDKTPFANAVERSLYKDKSELSLSQNSNSLKLGYDNGMGDPVIQEKYGNPDGSINEKAIIDRVNELENIKKGAQQSIVDNIAAGTLSPHDYDLKYIALAEMVRAEIELTRAKVINAAFNVGKEDNSLSTPDIIEVDGPQVDLGDLPDVDDMASAIKDKIDNFTPTKATMAQAKSDLMDDDPMPAFKSESEIDAYFDNMLLTLGEKTTIFEQELALDDTDYAGINQLFTSEEEFDQALRLLKHKAGLTKWIKDTRASHKEQLVNGPGTDAPDKPKVVNPDVPGESAGHILSQLGAAVPGFDQQKQIDSAAAKQGTLAGQIQYADYGNDILGQIPEDFYDLPAAEQIQVLKQLTGKSDSERALGELYKNYLLRSKGDKESLTLLQDFFEGKSSASIADKLRNQYGDPFTSTLEVITAVSTDMDEATDRVSKANDPLLRLRAERDLATARNKYIATLLVFDVDGGATDNQKKFVYNELKKFEQYIPEDQQKFFKTFVLKKKDIQSKPSDKNTSKGMLSTPDFDAALLGSTSSTGDAAAEKIFVGNAGIFDVGDAATHVSTGGTLSDVPDDFLRDAIVANLGANKRFQPFDMLQGFNKDNFAVVDSVTGKKYIVKTEDRNHMGHIQEALGAHLANELGFPTAGIRFGSDLKDTDLPDARKTAENVTQGRGRVMVIEHLENQFPNNEVKQFHDLPANAEISGESIARMMVLDRAMNYFDRTPGNTFAVKSDDGKWHLHPIDHGNAFRDWGGSGTEQAAGYTALAKGDNVNLMGLVAKLSPEEREEWANGLHKATQKVRNMNIEGSLGAPLKKGNITDAADAERLDKHLAYLAAKQKSLDWNDLTSSALAKAGLTPEQIDDVLSGGPELKKFAIGEGRATPLTGAAELLDALGDRNTGIARLYDGPDIEFSEIKIQKISATSLPKPDGTKSKSTNASLIQLKLRGNSQAKIDQEMLDPAANGWTILNNNGIPGPRYPSLNPSSGEVKKFSFANTTQNSLVSSDGFETYYKVLPDGQVLVVSKPSIGISSKNSYRNFAQVIVPGDSKVSLQDDVVASAMSALGVSETGHPSAEQVRELGVRRLANVVLGGQNVSAGDDLDALENKLKQQGVDVTDLAVRTAPNGSQYVGLSKEAASKLAQDLNFGHVHHTITHGQGNHNDKLVSILAGGAVNAGTDRYKSGIFVQGWSNSADINNGAGDYVFTHPRNGPLGGSPSEFAFYSFYSPSETVLGRLDHYSQSGDNCGNLTIRPPIADVMKSGGHKEMMIRDGLPATQGIWVVQENDRIIIKQKLAAIGVDEINGVPIDDIVVSQADAPAAYAKLYDRLKANGEI